MTQSLSLLRPKTHYPQYPLKHSLKRQTKNYLGSYPQIFPYFQNRKFDAYGDTIGNFDNYLGMRSLQPSMPETGGIVYEVPEDSTGYSIDFGKKGTNKIYRIKLK